MISPFHSNENAMILSVDHAADFGLQFRDITVPPRVPSADWPPAGEQFYHRDPLPA